MKVILLENIRKVGSIGVIIDVKRGFARNFLISKKKALFASKENIKEVEKIKVNPSLIQPIKEIKSIGIFKVVLNLHPEVQSQISINVISEDNK